MTTGILKDIRAEEYGFCIGDATVASLIKAYLQEMSVEDATRALGCIVSTRNKQATYTINGMELAKLIDRAAAASKEDSARWYALTNQQWMRTRINFLRNSFIPALDGKRYIAEMPYKMARFITDCWLAVS